MEVIESKFEAAIKLRDNGQLRGAVEILLTILKDFSNDSSLSGVHGVLGGIYYDMHEFRNSSEHFKRATLLNPNSELASLGLYLSYVELDQSDNAIEELQRYLESNPADLYKVTLKEILTGLEDGFMTDYAKVIRRLSEINGVV